ncbi:NifU family protein [Rhodococcus zopfii]|uniref:NifU family protein n=1 Tax=Rhodococcus zopfii TaxID=43772 RepID=UPI0036677ACD
MERWRESGDRIEALLDACSVAGPAARDRAEDLLREVLDLYGAGLARILDTIAAYPSAVDTVAGDDLVASLLLVHGLHPHDVTTRVRAALDSVRPYLGSHGGDVELLGIRGSVVRLRLLGNCRGCPSSAVTLELAVRDAVRAAAPEITDLDVETEPDDRGLIAPEALFAHIEPVGNGVWCAATEFERLAEGEVGGFTIDGVPVLACRLDGRYLAYRDRCPACGSSFAGAVLHRRAGDGAGAAVLRCPECRAHFDVHRAGARLDDGTAEHLDPLPILVRDGTLSLAVPDERPDTVTRRSARASSAPRRSARPSSAPRRSARPTEVT